jgi:Flp pilus assembly pilin Flp
VDSLWRWLAAVLPGQRGQDLVEYALLTIVLSLAIVGAVAAVHLEDSFATWASDVYDCIDSADCGA